MPHVTVRNTETFCGILHVCYPMSYASSTFSTVSPSVLALHQSTFFITRLHSVWVLALSASHPDFAVRFLLCWERLDPGRLLTERQAEALKSDQCTGKSWAEQAEGAKRGRKGTKSRATFRADLADSADRPIINHLSHCANRATFKMLQQQLLKPLAGDLAAQNAGGVALKCNSRRTPNRPSDGVAQWVVILLHWSS